MPYFFIEITQGTDYEASFTVNDPDTGLPVDISVGYTITGKIAKTEYDPEALYTFPNGTNGIQGTPGKLTIRIPGSVSSEWTFERVMYGIKVVNTQTNAEVMGVRGPLSVIHTVE